VQDWVLSSHSLPTLGYGQDLPMARSCLTGTGFLFTMRHLYSCLQGILGCDLVGFHIEDYCINFIDCCQRGLGCRVDRSGMLVEHGGRTVRVRPLPISIPFARFQQMAYEAPDSNWTDLKVNIKFLIFLSITITCTGYPRC
jgi:hypothetical protein